MKRIRFTEAWDKLADPRFTTIRSYRPEKERYYRSLVGETLTVWHATGRSFWNGRKVGEATLTGVREVRPADLPASLLARDVTLRGRVDTAWWNRLMAMDRALLLEFENHTGILAAGMGGR